MKLYGRTEELGLLSEAMQRKPNLVLVRGRRRVGKTTLITHAMPPGGVYLYVDQKKTEAGLLEEFETVLRRELGLPDYVRIQDWGQLYDLMFSHDRTFAIDEFQRLRAVSQSAIMQLQNKWDTKGQGSKTCLVLSGSNVGMMKKIFIEAGAPLFRRARHDLALKPLSFGECRRMMADLGVSDVTEQARLYAIFGGIPFYYALLEGARIGTWKDALKEAVLNPLSPLKNEVRDTMVESFGKDHPSYYAIISAIALGKTTKKEIADFSGIKESSLSPYLYDLENLVDVISYEVPVTEPKKWRTRRGRFVLKDNFFRFWFRYIFRNMSYFEEEEYGYLQDAVSEDMNSFMGPAFEAISREFLLVMDKQKKLPFKISEIGRWWSRKGDEVDWVIKCQSTDTIALVECKWSEKADSEKILGELMAREKLVEHKRKKVVYVIIARGFKSKTDGALCFDMEDISKSLGGL
ncbi:MAG: ATP-binding protein [Candidatus Micrarchaeota archaeon]